MIRPFWLRVTSRVGMTCRTKIYSYHQRWLHASSYSYQDVHRTSSTPRTNSISTDTPPSPPHPSIYRLHHTIPYASPLYRHIHTTLYTHIPYTHTPLHTYHTSKHPYHTIHHTYLSLNTSSCCWFIFDRFLFCFINAFLIDSSHNTRLLSTLEDSCINACCICDIPPSAA